MVAELRAHPGPIALRETADIDRLLDSRWYRFRRSLIRAADPWDLRVRRIGRRARRVVRRIVRSGRSIVGRARA